MKTFFVTASTLLLMGTLFVGCSHSAPKDPVPDTVVDTGANVKDPIKVSENHVFDAGTWHENENFNVQDHGGTAGQAVPTERFYSVDRDRWAPTGKMMYVLTDDSPAHCIKAKFVEMDGRKKMIVYSKSVVPTNYCIYQKTFTAEAEGFSIFVNDGGQCRPSYSVIKTDDQKRKLASVENSDRNVSMSYCVENTVSYGIEAEKAH